MGRIIISKIADNIISPLGYTTEENYTHVLAGETRLRTNLRAFDLPEAFCGSLLDRVAVEQRFEAEIGRGAAYTLFEKLCILSAHQAIAAAGIDPASSNVLFVLSTTKGNVSYLSESLTDERCFLAASAEKVASHFSNPHIPILVSNACISGVSAQILAIRALLGRKYEYVVVIGCDLLSAFIVSGFQSFKALSPCPCQPYDKDRIGLNLGEAVGTLVFKGGEVEDPSVWQYVACSLHNDANHISGPSRTGEGVYRVLSDILKQVSIDEIALINTHGTATVYNDEMESIALHRAQLDGIPVNGFKGYYGHTLGAAGVVETILSMKTIEQGFVLPTKGFKTPGTSYSLSVSNELRTTSKRTFIKTISGFGGCNAGIAYRKGGAV